MRSPLAAVGPALLYVALILPSLVDHAPVLLRPELYKIAHLLGTPAGAAISWTHFLAFDLLVSRWIFLDSRRRKISGWISAPVLFLTLLLGPVGFLLHLILRRVVTGAKFTKSASLSEFTD